MVALRPGDQLVGKINDALRRAPRVRQGLGGHVQLFEKAAQVFGTGRGKGLVDGLVWVAHPHPVAIRTSQQAQQFFLQPAAVLGFIFQDIGPAGVQAVAEKRIRLQRLQSQPDQVIKIHRPAIAERALVVGIDGAPHLGQWQRRRRLVQLLAQGAGRELQVFGIADHIEGDPFDRVRQLFPPDPIRLVFRDLRVQKAVQIARVVAQPGQGGGLTNSLGLPLVDDVELLAQPHQRRALPDNVVAEAVQGAHAIANGQQPI